MTDEEFKRSLGIHPLDHLKISDPETLEFIKKRYPNIEMNTSSYLSGEKTVRIKIGDKEISRSIFGDLNCLDIISMLKELDP
jgi:hypothetical protein